jgi:FAD/FMN-containing dehydrogenase
LSTDTGAATAARPLDDDAVAGLAAGLRGRLVGPADPDYDTVRAVWNGMVDKRPRLVVRCAGVADVIAAVAFGREYELPLAVRGGGHNVSGNAVTDGGLVVDLSTMRGVRVDPASSTVRAEGGVTIGDLDRETQAFGLAVPMGVVTETGIAGLTLSGGLGWLRRKHGLSCDALVSADVVTAAGDVVTASADSHPELLWALKGGGGNFGVVTSLEYRALPVGPEVFLAFVVHAGADAGQALRAYREWAADAPDEVSSFAILWHAPSIEEIPVEHHHLPIAVYLAMHCGSVADGERALQPLRDLGRPIADLSGPSSYLDVQRFFDADYPAHTMRYYWKSRYLPELADGAIDRLVELNEASPSPHSTLDVWQLGGALARVGARDTAFGDRSAAFLIGIESNWEDAADDEVAVNWGREVFGALEPYATAAEYLNFPGTYENHERMVRATFGPNLDRLVAAKRRYDPDNLFRLNSNIRPDW